MPFLKPNSIIILLFCLSVAGFGQSYSTNGNAVNLGNDCYRITNEVNFQNGTVWYSNTLNLNEPFAFDFYMNFGDNDADGADGMVFVLQQQGVNAIGINGSGMGYQGFFPSFGIEFDTYSNNADPFTGQNMGDPMADHCAFLKSGDVNHASANNLAGPVQLSSTNANVEDGDDHVVKITWDPTTETVELYFDCVLRLSDNIDLLGNIFTNSPNVYFGFTGSTGGFNNLQLVCLQENIIPSPESASICFGESVALNAGGDPGSTYSWSPVDGLSDPTVQNPTASPAVTTNYTVTLTDFCGNPIQREFEVIVLSPPEVDAGSDISFCENESVSLNGDVTGQQNFSWIFTDDNIVFGNNNLAPTISTAGTYELTATNSDGCTASDQVIVSQIPLPTINLGDDFAICSGETTSLTLSGTYDNVLWSTDETSNSIDVAAGNYSVEVTTNTCSASDDIIITETVLPNIELGQDLSECSTNSITLDAGTFVTWSNGESGNTITVNTTGNYIATATVDGCTTSDDVTLTFFNQPIVDLGDDLFLCPDETITLNAVNIALWSTGESANAIEVIEAGIYTATVTNGPCVASDQVEIFTIDNPSVNLGDDITICNDVDYILSAANENISEYLWSTGSEVAFIEPKSSGEYSVIVTNVCGSASDTINIEIEECDYFIFIPNAFTPDDDGINDIWKITSQNILSMEITVFDRWGDIVFYTKSMDDAWLGNKRDSEYYSHYGVYNYYIKYLAENGDAGSRRGHITLLR